MKRNFTFRLDERDITLLEAEAERQDRPVSYLIRKALERAYPLASNTVDLRREEEVPIHETMGEAPR